MPSFDVVSRVDLQEVDNAVNQARREISQRYDFRNSRSEIRWDPDKREVTLTGDDDYKLKALIDILQTKLAKRGVSLKALEYGRPVDASGGLRRQTIKVRQGIPQDKAREIVKFIKGLKLKVQAQIQEDQVRVSGKKIDDLQAIIGALKAEDFNMDLQFVNMRR